MSTRREHRAERYRRTFEGARLLTFRWPGRAVIPRPSFTEHRLVALEDEDGFVLQLGIVMECDLDSSRVTLLTPLRSLDDVDTLHVGDVAVHPKTFEDRRL